jgi:hypothetical protein
MTTALREHRLSKLGRDITLLKWMAGFQIALSAATLAILLRSLS